MYFSNDKEPFLFIFLFFLSLCNEWLGLVKPIFSTLFIIKIFFFQLVCGSKEKNKGGKGED